MLIVPVDEEVVVMFHHRNVPRGPGTTGWTVHSASSEGNGDTGTITSVDIWITLPEVGCTTVTRLEVGSCHTPLHLPSNYTRSLLT
ncbi:hypothetical protein E2C01_012534 [Portunus trituberculatus]|uniref:Uncharacterized protein n=1 Tax=Portunus trituberculatus TaxID=210409 RepID=A0A5B7DED9_PORTR|nr:hypothetical protein [Portunus trituberculatus]